MARRLAAGRLALIGAAALAVATLIDPAYRDDRSSGSALADTKGGAILQPLPPATPLSLGIVPITNQSRKPIELVDARLLRLDPEVHLLGFSVLPTGPNAYGANPPITWLEWPLKGAVPLAKYPSVPPSSDGHEQAAVMFGLSVEPHKAGKAVGIEVTYRQASKLRKQVFAEQVYVCWVPSHADSDCPGVNSSRYSDVFGDFDDEVRAKNRG